MSCERPYSPRERKCFDSFGRRVTTVVIGLRRFYIRCTQIPRIADAPVTYGITADEREQMLLDDLRVEVKRLADAVERQNELLATVAADEGGHR